MKEVKLMRIYYDEEQDMFFLATKRYDTDEWETAVGVECVAREGDVAKQFIHFSILNELKDYADFGYTLLGW